MNIENIHLNLGVPLHIKIIKFKPRSVVYKVVRVIIKFLIIQLSKHAFVEHT